MRYYYQTWVSAWAAFLTILIFYSDSIVEVHSNTRRHHSNQHLSLAREWSSRLQECAQWACGQPKPKLVYINDEHRSRMQPHTNWIPKVAVVFRCEQATGCCSNHPTDTCKPTSFHTISLVFQKINMVTSDTSYERLSFSNHTACACQSEESDV